MDSESFTHYLNAKNNLRNSSPQKKRSARNASPQKLGLKAPVKPISTLIKHEIWVQGMSQLESQLLQNGAVQVPHFGTFWVQKHETELPGAGKSFAYTINFLIEENISPHMFKMKNSTIGKSIVESTPLDTRRIAIDLGSVTKERVRMFFRDFATQLALEVKKLNVSSQLAVPFLDYGKITFTATNYAVRWDKSFLTKVKDTLKRKREEKRTQIKNSDKTQETQNEVQETVPVVSVEKNNEIAPDTTVSNSPQITKRGTSEINTLTESQSLLLPSFTKNDDSAEVEAKKAKKELHEKWKLQMREREEEAKKERDSELKQREINEAVAEIFTSSEKRKQEERRLRERKNMTDNLQIAELVKNIRSRTGDVIECGDIFEKRRIDHPVFSKEQLMEDLKKQIDERKQLVVNERNATLEAERQEFEHLQQLNQSYKAEMQNVQSQKIKHQKQLLEQQMKEREKQAIIMFDEERRREEAEQVLVPGHDEEIASNSKKIAKELLNQALNDVMRKKEERKKQHEEDALFARTQAEYLQHQDALMKAQSIQKQKETQKEMKRFWDSQVGISQWKNPVA